MRDNLEQTRNRLVWLSLAMLTAFGAISLAASYWTLVRGPSMLERSDNPRLVEEELRIRRGSILDVNSHALAVTADKGGETLREYLMPSAAPVVGYYSLRHGTSGIEEAFDTHLRGETADFWTNFWHFDTLGEPQVGRDLRLTVDSRWQEAATDLLAERSGAVLLFSLPDVAVRAMASSPGYDPNSLDLEFEQLVVDEAAPLLNRVTQGQYQPGLLLQPFLMAVASQDGLIDMAGSPGSANSEVDINGTSLTCQLTGASAELTWAETMAAKCPGPLAKFGQESGSDWILAALGSFGLTRQPDLPIVAGTVDEMPIDNAGLAAIGQDTMAISPLQLGLALACLANEGQFWPAQLVAARQNERGQWVTEAQLETGEQVVAAEVAREMLSTFPIVKGIREHQVIVLSGPKGDTNSWYLGLAPSENPRYGVVVVVENDQVQSSTTETESSATMIGRTLFKEVLNPEKP